jgi:hypothetical protein
MINRRQYIEYLISTSGNYTCSNLAAHLDGVSHDGVSDYLRADKLTARSLWEQVQPLLKDSSEAYLLVDDSVQNKQYSQRIELVKQQYSGAEHGLVRGIGVVNLVHSDGESFYPIDYRIYAPDQDGKSKNEHFREMLIRARSDKNLKARTVLFDSWYAASDNLKLIVRLGMYFVTTLKSNRMVSLTAEAGYVHLDSLRWDAHALEYGLSVKLKDLPFRLQLFKVVATNGDIDWIITNHPEHELTTHDLQAKNAVRWHIEQLHRELKQLTGTEQCQCRKARSQRNHLGCCYLAWLALRRRATQMHRSLYAVQHALFSDYLRAELRQPHIPVFAST